MDGRLIDPAGRGHPAHVALGPGAGALRRTVGELLALAYATSGLLVMRWTGFAVPVWLTLAAGGAATVALAVLPPDRRVARFAVVAAAMAVVGTSGAVVAGVWIGVGLVVADVVVRGAPGWPLLSGAHPSLLVPVTLLMAMAAWRADETTYRLGPAPFILAAGITLLTAVSMRAPWRHHAAWAGAVGLLYAATAFRAHIYNLALAAGPVLVSVLALLWWSARRGPEGRCAPWRSVGPLVAAAPALLWWMVNAGVATVGEWTTQRHLYGAWDAYASTLPNRFTDLNAVTGIPAVLAALLASGAFMAVLGRRGAQAVALAVVIGGAMAAAIATSWQVGLA